MCRPAGRSMRPSSAVPPSSASAGGSSASVPPGHRRPRQRQMAGGGLRRRHDRRHGRLSLHDGEDREGRGLTTPPPNYRINSLYRHCCQVPGFGWGNGGHRLGGIRPRIASDVEKSSGYNRLMVSDATTRTPGSFAVPGFLRGFLVDSRVRPWVHSSSVGFVRGFIRRKTGGFCAITKCLWRV